ncbi:MAG: SAM-dependent DNA methyltransferase [Armatimonadetes bacterium]|nr:SAM-dependent DNA methyltransferase [Armatimonadota bacterium]
MEVCRVVASTGFQPASILEPTCGVGGFLQAASQQFPATEVLKGFDINAGYVQSAQQVMQKVAFAGTVTVEQGDYFAMDWQPILAVLPSPLLIIGNPPWVTTAGLGAIGSKNAPQKANTDALRGIDAITGSSNFDISEWMLRQQIRWLVQRGGMIAVLCKTSVARKVLMNSWEDSIPVALARMYRIDAQRYFGAAVDACLFILHVATSASCQECAEYASVDTLTPARVFGLRNGRLIADVRMHNQWGHLAEEGLSGWRSGVKHDCSQVFELRSDGDAVINGANQIVKVEPSVLFPMMKSSDLAGGRSPSRYLLLTQRSIGDAPERLCRQAPLAWKYLLENGELLDQRRSSIYKNRPRFSMFGIGPYSFAPWKVAISGLYKRLTFSIVPPFNNQPVLFDDTCYFFPCRSQQEGELLLQLLNSRAAQEFFLSHIFWDTKRPITAGLLNRLSLHTLAQSLGYRSSENLSWLIERQRAEYGTVAQQMVLLWQ